MRVCGLTVDAAAVAQARLVLPPDVMDMIELDHRLRAGVLKAVGVDRVVVPAERELVMRDPRAERGRRGWVQSPVVGRAGYCRQIHPC